MVFKDHSTRAASSTCTKEAMEGLTVEDIIEVADWSVKGILQKFYKQPKHSLAYGSKVLAAGASKSHVDMETKPSEIKKYSSTSYLGMGQVQNGCLSIRYRSSP